jgi:hypothetical protein
VHVTGMGLNYYNITMFSRWLRMQPMPNALAVMDPRGGCWRLTIHYVLHGRGSEPPLAWLPHPSFDSCGLQL